MALLIDAGISGILIGGLYALMASGLTLIFGVMEIINIAQGIFVILGAYLTTTLEHAAHIDPFLSLFITVPFMFFLGLAIEWIFLRRINRNRVMLSILVTYAIALVIEGLLNMLFTTDLNFMQISDASLHIASFSYTYVSIALFLMSIILLTALYWLIYRTTFGMSLRATMQNRTASALVGIDVERVSAIAFGIGTALAAIGGMGYGTTAPFNAASSYDLISRVLIIIILGGLGSMRGALIASFILLVAGDMVAVVWSASWSNLSLFVLLVVLLLFRPQGLFGKSGGQTL